MVGGGGCLARSLDATLPMNGTCLIIQSPRPLSNGHQTAKRRFTSCKEPSPVSLLFAVIFHNHNVVGGCFVIFPVWSILFQFRSIHVMVLY